MTACVFKQHEAAAVMSVPALESASGFGQSTVDDFLDPTASCLNPCRDIYCHLLTQEGEAHQVVHLVGVTARLADAHELDVLGLEQGQGVSHAAILVGQAVILDHSTC